MRTVAFLSVIPVLAAAVGACGLSVDGLAEGLSDGGTGLDGPASAEGSGGGSGGGSSGSSSGAGKDSSGSSSGGDSGKADSTTPPGDAASEESSQPETSTQDVVSEPPPQETGTTCTTAQGCYVIPGGWQLVAFAGSQSTGCPSGFSSGNPVNYVEGPDTAGSCSCGTSCSIDEQPSCLAGPIGVSYDVASVLGGVGNCGTAGQPAQMNNSPAGSCGTDMYNGSPLLSYSSLDLEYSPANQPGGHCNSGAAVVGTVTFDSQDRACPPDSAQAGGCNGNECTPDIPAPYQVCVIESGAQTCPSGSPFTQQHLIGSGFGGLTCSTCDCAVQGTCSGGTMKLFTNGGCSAGELDITADGKCHSSNAPGGATYDSYEYVANAPTGVGCQPSGTSTPSGGSLTNEQTICCAP